ncbi:quinolinate synthase NadA [Candidatus Bathyarchaeota archaeon]|nr:quinolinate synthase NadA [Candidatus Bathyarchaeota archaeon]
MSEKIQMLKEKINQLKKDKDAVLLVHNYQVNEVQEVADFIGDSLELSRKAQNIESKMIIFCGVDFMAETASILNPEKKVILPNLSARCPMAAQLPLKTLLKTKNENPGVPVVLYVNTLAEAKAECDVTCTSANAVQIIQKLDKDKVIFGPDWNLGYYVKKRVSNVELIPVPKYGFCNTHKLFKDGIEALELKKKYPEADLLVHPECDPGFQDNADYVLSTGGMYRHCKESSKKIFIIGTEIGMVDRLRREIPSKTFLPANPNAECPSMKRITLQNTYEALVNEDPIVKVPKEICIKALKPIERMLEMSK